jgi:hypothetical protein
MPKLAAGALAVVTTLCACVPRAIYTPRVGSCPKRPADCSFEVISSRPTRDYSVIGVIEVESFHVRNLPKDETAFRSVVAGEVCAAGGDAVVPGINGNGRYVLATVVKWVDEGATTPVCPKSSGDAGAGDGGVSGVGAAPDAGAAPQSKLSEPTPSASQTTLARSASQGASGQLPNRAGASW